MCGSGKLGVEREGIEGKEMEDGRELSHVYGEKSQDFILDDTI